jgi:hypothetical protein
MNILFKIWYLQVNIKYVPALKPAKGTEWKHDTVASKKKTGCQNHALTQ